MLAIHEGEYALDEKIRIILINSVMMAMRKVAVKLPF